MGLSINDGWKLIVNLNRSLATSSSLIALNKAYSSTAVLAIKVSTSTSKPTWFSGGKFWNSYYLGQEYYLDESWDLKLDVPQLIRIPKPRIKPSYALFYEPPNWFKNFNIKIWENKNMGLYIDTTQAAGVSEIATVTSVTVNSFATPTSLLAANFNRRGYSIRNRGTKIALIGFNATFTPATAFLSLPAGATYESDKLYLGALFGSASKTGETTDLTITEFT